VTEPALLLADDPDHTTAQFNLLAPLTDPERQRVRAAGRLLTHAANTPVFHQGNRQDGIFLIESGRVRTYYTSPAGREITLAYWTQGHFVGGPEIFGGGTHVWSGLAIGPTATRHLPGPAIRRLMTDMPALAVCLVEALSHKGRCYSELLQVLATQSVEERLRQLLQNLGRLYGIEQRGHTTIDRIFGHEDLATDMHDMWLQTDYTTRLDPDLLALISDEANWIVERGMVKTDKPSMDHLRAYVDEAPLKQALPANVTLP
jgi:CRP-like cAMP-binding protein